MGLLTGSDADIKSKMRGQLLDKYDFQGEGLVGRRVWAINSHFPERLGKNCFDSSRAILIVRSPLDCITSFFHFLLSGSFVKSISD